MASRETAPASTATRQFDFGQNWDDYSRHALTPDRVAQARADFARLTEGVELRGRRFLDVGFGQGLSLLSAASTGAALAVGCDINPKCKQVLSRNRERFPDLPGAAVEAVVGSILEEPVVERLAALAGPGGYDVVHSWGVLHHTGDMARAVAHTASLVRPGGTAVTTRFVADHDALATAGVDGINFQVSVSTGLLERLAHEVASGRLAAPPITSVKLTDVPVIVYGAGPNRADGKTVVIP